MPGMSFFIKLHLEASQQSNRKYDKDGGPKTVPKLVL